ncbi:MAG: abscisic acid-deficient protein Aba4 family protein [Candidatus Thermoplasmatota archaeon]|nr:abscisic acid-deficient protein Aba4 family protein [Candidatus Thermoplasmatota archaeon]
MDIYDVSFILSTMWVGPFWFAMLVFPEHEKTEKAMRGPWFFLGPILIWFIVTASDPEGLVELARDSMEPSNAMSGLATLLGSRAGAAAAWAHMVAGDIFVTRWMWKRCIDRGAERWVTASSVFFGVMLMPVGVALHVGLVRDGAD